MKILINGGKGGEDPFFQLSGDQLIEAVLQLAKLSDYPDFLTCQKILALDSSDLIDSLRDSFASRVKAADKFIPDKYSRSLKDICTSASKKLAKNNNLFANSNNALD